VNIIVRSGPTGLFTWKQNYTTGNWCKGEDSFLFHHFNYIVKHFLNPEPRVAILMIGILPDRFPVSWDFPAVNFPVLRADLFNDEFSAITLIPKRYFFPALSSQHPLCFEAEGS
jgi:hypothetical protein